MCLTPSLIYKEIDQSGKSNYHYCYNFIGFANRFSRITYGKQDLDCTTIENFKRNCSTVRGILAIMEIYASSRDDILIVRCGTCLQCQMQYSSDWSMRCAVEASKHKDNCVFTLTYNDENLPYKGSLLPDDMTKYIKLLRYYIDPQKIRYFYCGEYGHATYRPHYHMICFGYKPNDLLYHGKSKSGNPLFISPYIRDKVWKKGFVYVEEFDVATVHYSCKYLSKDVFRTGMSKELIAPFVRMSNRPGIGYDDEIIERIPLGKAYINGKEFYIPRYYRKKFIERYPEVLDSSFGLTYNRDTVLKAYDKFAKKVLKEVVRR